MRNIVIQGIRTLGAASLLLSLGFTAAQAQTRDDKLFDGFYLGFEAGIDHQEIDFANNPAGTSLDDTAFYSGIAGGWRNQWDNGFVFGIELTQGFTGPDINGDITLGDQVFPVRHDGDTRGSVAGIFGYTSPNAPEWLFFVRPGVSILETAFDDEAIFDLGGGVEYALNRNLRIRATGSYEFDKQVSVFDFSGVRGTVSLLWQF